MTFFPRFSMVGVCMGNKQENPHKRLSTLFTVVVIVVAHTKKFLFALNLTMYKLDLYAFSTVCVGAWRITHVRIERACMKQNAAK